MFDTHWSIYTHDLPLDDNWKDLAKFFYRLGKRDKHIEVQRLFKELSEKADEVSRDIKAGATGSRGTEEIKAVQPANER
jgi:hypothetical protein